jgi:hypothetical protein
MHKQNVNEMIETRVGDVNETRMMPGEDIQRMGCSAALRAVVEHGTSPSPHAMALSATPTPAAIGARDSHESGHSRPRWKKTVQSS